MSVLPTTRKRDRNGKYISFGKKTDASQKDLQRRRERIVQNKQIGSDLYSSYLDACFLEGNQEKYWVMADANVGPLAEASVALLKPSYLPTAKERCEQARKRFFHYEEGKLQRDIKQEYVLDGNNVKGKRKRRRIFKGWRLPHLGRAGEVAKVKAWIQDCLHHKALTVRTVEDAYDVLRTFFVRAKQYKSEVYYELYPPIHEKDNEKVDDDASSSLPENGNEHCEPSEHDSNTPNENCEHNIDLSECALDLFGSAPAEGDMVYFAHIRRILLAARNDRLFFFLCKVGEDVAECKIDCVAAALLDVCKTDALQCDILVTDALRYASARQRGVQDLEAFHIQKHRVRTNTALLKIARATIPGARPFEEMSWVDFSSQIRSELN